MELLLYGVVKFVAYSLWGFLGFRLHQPKATAGAAIRFGAVRWLLGLVFGVMVFFAAGSVNREQILSLYLAIYIPVRLLEWTIMTAMFFPTWQNKWQSRFLYYWIVGGVILSFLTDFVSPEMLNGGRFCVGRCLC